MSIAEEPNQAGNRHDLFPALITIVGLGPYGMDEMTTAALRALESADKLFFRTAIHPAAQELAERGLVFETFDSVYETAASFEEVYSTIAFRVIGEARKHDVTYAVPGHPLVAEKAVDLIIKRAAEEGIPVKIAPSPSFIDACLESLAYHLDTGLKLIDALAIAKVAPATDVPNLIYQVYDRQIASDVKLALMEVYPDEFAVYVISGGGGRDAKVENMPLYEMDRREYDHLTSVFVPELE